MIMKITPHDIFFNQVNNFAALCRVDIDLEMRNNPRFRDFMNNKKGFNHVNQENKN